MNDSNAENSSQRADVQTPRRRRKRKLTPSKKKWNQVKLIVGALLFSAAAIATMYWFFFVKNSRELQPNPVVGNEQTLDINRDYVYIRDRGTLPQLLQLLAKLDSVNLSAEAIPARLDHYNKTVQIADKIIGHADRSESERVVAARSKLNGFWRSYVVNFDNDLNDPFIAEQFFGAAEQLLNDPDPNVARDAYLVRARALVSERLKNRSLGTPENVRSSLIDLVTRFPEDPTVVDNIRDLFTRVRAVNSEEAARLAAALAEITDRSSDPNTRKLSRFFKDIIVLFDTGIGNFDAIVSIIVDDEQFMSRLTLLNDDLDTGITVVNQLDNGINFFERQGKYERALELSRRILENSHKRTDSEAKALAEIVGRNGVQRNSLVGKKWSFEGVNRRGEKMLPERYQGQVVLVCFFDARAADGRQQRELFSHLQVKFFGKSVEFIDVEVDALDPTIEESDWVTVDSRSDDPHPFMVQCPTRRFPYSVLIERDGTVTSINRSYNYVATHIESLLSKR